MFFEADDQDSDRAPEPKHGKSSPAITCLKLCYWPPKHVIEGLFINTDICRRAQHEASGRLTAHGHDLITLKP